MWTAAEEDRKRIELEQLQFEEKILNQRLKNEKIKNEISKCYVERSKTSQDFNGDLATLRDTF